MGDARKTVDQVLVDVILESTEDELREAMGDAEFEHAAAQCKSVIDRALEDARQRKATAHLPQQGPVATCECPYCHGPAEVVCSGYHGSWAQPPCHYRWECRRDGNEQGCGPVGPWRPTMEEALRSLVQVGLAVDYHELTALRWWVGLGWSALHPLNGARGGTWRAQTSAQTVPGGEWEPVDADGPSPVAAAILALYDKVVGGC